VRTVKGSDRARIVEFQKGTTWWIGLEVQTGGSGISQKARFSGRRISESDSDYPKKFAPSEVDKASRAAFSGNRAEVTQECSRFELALDGDAPNDGYTFGKDSNDNLEISTPNGNKVKLTDAGDVVAFA